MWVFLGIWLIRWCYEVSTEDWRNSDVSCVRRADSNDVGLRWHEHALSKRLPSRAAGSGSRRLADASRPRAAGQSQRTTIHHRPDRPRRLWLFRVPLRDVLDVSSFRSLLFPGKMLLLVNISSLYFCQYRFSRCIWQRWSCLFSLGSNRVVHFACYDWFLLTMTSLSTNALLE